VTLAQPHLLWLWDLEKVRYHRLCDLVMNPAEVGIRRQNIPCAGSGCSRNVFTFASSMFISRRITLAIRRIYDPNDMQTIQSQMKNNIHTSKRKNSIDSGIKGSVI